MLELRDIVIDPEFEKLIPPLSEDERNQLVANIERDGFRDPLVVWMNHAVLLDGHNRFRIWEDRFQGDENREPEIKELKFATREDAMTWIITNQLGRRNLPDAVRVQLALRLRPSLELKAKENQKSGGSAGGKSEAKGSQNSVKPSEKVDVQKEIAKAAGVSHDTVRKVETVLLIGDEEVKSDMLAGRKSGRMHVLSVTSQTVFEGLSATTLNCANSQFVARSIGSSASLNEQTQTRGSFSQL